jgi:hypothetical protein
MQAEAGTSKGCSMASTDPNPPRTLSTGASLLLAVACLLYIAMMFLILGSEPVIDCGDPASCGITKGLGEAFEVLGGFCTLLLWIVLAILLFTGGIKEERIRSVTAILFLLSGVAAIVAGILYSRYGAWSIVVPGLLPPLIAFYAVWARLPALHTALPAKIVNVTAWGAILILTIAPFPLYDTDARSFAAAEVRQRAQREAAEARMLQEQAQDEQRAIARFQALNPDSPLSDYLHDLYFPHPYATGEAHHQEALTKARQVKSRQTDAVMLLKQGRIESLEELWSLDIEATPDVCAAYGDALREDAAKIDMGTTTGQETVERQLPNMKWLVGAHCDLDAALGFVEKRFREWCDGPHQCAASDIADRPTLNFLDALVALRQPH